MPKGDSVVKNEPSKQGFGPCHNLEWVTWEVYRKNKSRSKSLFNYRENLTKISVEDVGKVKCGWLMDDRR